MAERKGFKDHKDSLHTESINALTVLSPVDSGIIFLTDIEQALKKLYLATPGKPVQ